MMHFVHWPPEGDARPHMGYSYRDSPDSAWEIWEVVKDDFVQDEEDSHHLQSF